MLHARDQLLAQRQMAIAPDPNQVSTLPETFEFAVHQRPIPQAQGSIDPANLVADSHPYAHFGYIRIKSFRRPRVRCWA